MCIIYRSVPPASRPPTESILDELIAATIGPLKRIAVEIIFDTVDALNRALPGLIENDFETLYLEDQMVEEPPTEWLLVWILTRDDVDSVMTLVGTLVVPCGGIVWEGGIVSDEELAAWIRHDDLFTQSRKLS